MTMLAARVVSRNPRTDEFEFSLCNDSNIVFWSNMSTLQLGDRVLTFNCHKISTHGDLRRCLDGYRRTASGTSRGHAA